MIQDWITGEIICNDIQSSALQSCCFPVAVGLRGPQMCFLCIPQKVEKYKKAFFYMLT